MSTSHLDKQIEQIADEATGRTVSVIVQMRTSDDMEQYLEAATGAIDARRAVTSARTLVPPSRSQLRTGVSGGITPAAKRKLEQGDRLSAMVFLATELIKPLAREALNSYGLQALAPLLESDWVADTIAARRPAARTRAARPAGPVTFPLSGSAVLELSKDELKNLPTRVANIADIYPNRLVKVPPVAKATALPRVVEDNRPMRGGWPRPVRSPPGGRSARAARERSSRCSTPAWTRSIRI